MEFSLGGAPFANEQQRVEIGGCPSASYFSRSMPQPFRALRQEGEVLFEHFGTDDAADKLEFEQQQLNLTPPGRVIMCLDQEFGLDPGSLSGKCCNYGQQHISRLPAAQMVDSSRAG